MPEFLDAEIEPDFEDVDFSVLDINLEHDFAERSDANFQQKFSALQKMAFTPGALVAGGLDTLYNSVPFVDEDREMITDLTKVMGDDFAEFFKQNRSGFTAIADVALTIPVVGYASKAVQTGSFIEKGFHKLGGSTKAGKFIFANADNLDTRIAALMQKQTALLKTGERNFERVESFVNDQNKVKLGYAADLLKQTVASDIAFIGALNSSEFMFPDEMDFSTAALWFAIPDAAIVGVGYGIARSALKRRLAQEAPALQKAFRAGEAMDTGMILDRAGRRDTKIMFHGLNAQVARAEMKAFDNSAGFHGTNQIGVEAQNGIVRENEIQIAETFAKISNDQVYPYIPRNNFAPGTAEALTMKDNAIRDPASVASLVGADEATMQAAVALEKGRLQHIEAMQFDLAQTRKGIADIGKQSKTAGNEKRLSRLYSKQEQLQADLLEQNGVVMIVHEIDGGLTPLSQRFFTLADSPDKLKWVDDLEPDSHNFTTLLNDSKGAEVRLSFMENGSLILEPVKETKKVFETIKRNAKANQITADQAVQEGKAFFAKQLNKLDPATRPAVWAGAQRQLGIWEKRAKAEPDFRLLLKESQHYTTLDMISEFAKRYPDNVMLDAGSEFKTMAAVEFESLRQKFREYYLLHEPKHLANVQRSASAGIDTRFFESHSLARLFNLPSGDAGIPAPLMEVMKEIAETGMHGRKTLEIASDLKTYFRDMDALKENMNKLLRYDELKMGISDTEQIVTRGRMIEFGRDTKKKPFIGVHKANPEDRVSRQGIQNIQRQMHLESMSILAEAKNEGALLVDAALAPLFANAQAVKTASRVQDLSEGMLQGRGVTSTQAFKNRGVPPLEAMDTLVDMGQKNALTEVVAKVIENRRPIFNKLFSSAVDLDNFNVGVNSLRFGWHVDLSKGIVPLENGLIGLPLNKKSKVNLQLWEEHVGNRAAAIEAIKSEDAWVMPLISSGKNGGDTPLALSNLAFEGIKAISELSQMTLGNWNLLRRARGLPAINKKQLHIPAADITKEAVVYLSNEFGSVKHQISGKTQKQAWLLAQKEVDARRKAGEHLHRVSAEDVRADFKMMGDVFDAPRNFSIPHGQTGAAKGKRGQEVIPLGKGVLEDILDTIEMQMLTAVRESHATFFESELHFAQRQAASFQSGSNIAKFEKNQSIWDVYANTTLQRGTLNKNTNLGNLYYGVENAYDDSLRAIFDKSQELLAPAVKGRPALAQERVSLAEYNKRFGNYSPFKDIDEYMEKTVNVPRPQNLRKHVTFLSQFTTAMVLRVLDLGMALVNVASLAATTPSVMAAVQPTARELAAGAAGREMWKARTGAFGLPVDFDLGLVKVDPLRMSMSGMHAFWSGEHAEALTRAAEMGLLKQDVAERMKTFIAPRLGYTQNLIRNQVDMMSLATDRSEEWSRRAAFAMFYDFGRKQLKMNKDASVLFAHNQANKNISDFRPINKPQMFQGSVGAPLGLFTTWVWNLMQRVYGDVERQAFTPAVWQYIMQHSLFGAGSLPGFESFVDVATTNYDGSENLITRMDRDVGTTATDYFMTGALGNLPKVFGLADGIAVQSRADVTMPSIFQSVIPGSGQPLTQALPAFGVMSDLATLFKEEVTDIAQSGQFDLANLRENLAVYGVNGALRNSMQMWQGYATDRQRQLVNQDVRRLPDTLARIFELKTNQEIARTKYLAKFRNQQARKRELINQLSKRTRTGIRSGAYQGEGARERLETDFKNYYRAGGSPSLAGQWFRQQAVEAKTNKMLQNYVNILKKSRDEGGMVRLLELTQEKD